MARSREVKILITGDASSAQRAFQDAESGASRFGNVKRLGVAAFAAIGVAAGGLIGMGVKVAADAQTAAVGFETMLGSGEKAAAFMKDLQAFAAKTPFEFPELRDAAS